MKTGNFYAEPNPEIQLRQSGRLWHLGKLFFEQYWMGEGFERTTARLALAAGGRLFGVSAML